MNRLLGIGVGQAKLESQQRRRCIGDNFGALDLKAQIRHEIPLPLRPLLSTSLDRSRFQAGEKLAQLPPHFRAARQALPVHANQAHQLVAFVDGKQVILGAEYPRE